MIGVASPFAAPVSFYHTLRLVRTMNHMRRFLFLSLFIASGLHAQPSAPGNYLLDASLLRASAEAVQRKESVALPAFKRLVKDADKLLKTTPKTIIDKPQVPPSGDKHDYTSMSRYWWPDPSKPDGLPYIRRDGETNPESEDIPDQYNYGRITSGTWTLSLAYYFTGNVEYAKQAARYVRMWYLDSATAMNPNLNYSQYVKGRGDGRSSGVLDGRGIHRIVEAIGLINGSGAWTKDDQARMLDWMKRYWEWLQTHPNAIGESEATNNHGVWFDVHAVSIACFVGDFKAARAILERAKTERIGKQIEPDGSLPRELARTRSRHYVMFNLEAFSLLAAYGRDLGVDLWNYRSDDGRSLRGAFNWLASYINGEREWAWKDIDEPGWHRYYFVLLQADAAYPDAGFGKVAKRFEPEKGSSDVIHLILAR